MNDGVLRSLLIPVYLPSVLFAIGQGAVVPIVALAADDLGASTAVAGLAVVARSVGIMAFDIPAGQLVARVGERTAMIAATAGLTVALIGAVVTSSPAVFVALMFVVGCAWSVWMLARLTYVTESVPAAMRGRALSTLGGCQRIGAFLGPFLAAGVIRWVGLAGAFYVHIATAVVGCVVLVVVADLGDHRPDVAGHVPPRLRTLAREHRRNLAMAGGAAIVVSALRAARPVVLPLWAVAIDLDAMQISVIFGLSAAIDMALFYPAGHVADRWGRRVSAVLTLVPMAAGFLLVPLTSGFGTLLAVGVLIGLGNGMGSGIVMTLGSDIAPAIGRAEMLGLWRLITDAGGVAGPLLVAGVEAVTTMGAASVTVGALGLGGAALAAATLPTHYPTDASGAGGSAGDGDALAG